MSSSQQAPYFTEVPIPEDSVFYRIYKKVKDGGVRLELKNSSFGIGMVIFQFQALVPNGQGGMKENGRVKIYLSFDQTLSLCRKIMSGTLSPNEKGISWKSDPMGTSAKNLEIQAQRTGNSSILRNGMAEYRLMYIKAGNRVPYILTGLKSDGFENQYKLFQPVVNNGQPQNGTKIMVPLSSTDAEAIATRIQQNVQGFITAQYMMLGMRPFIGNIGTAVPGAQPLPSPEEAERAAVAQPATVPAPAPVEAQSQTYGSDYGDDFDITTSDLPF